MDEGGYGENVEWNRRIVLCACLCDTDNIAGVCSDLLQMIGSFVVSLLAGVAVCWINIQVNTYSVIAMPWRKEVRCTVCGSENFQQMILLMFNFAIDGGQHCTGVMLYS